VSCNFLSRRYSLLYQRVGTFFLANMLSFIGELDLSLLFILSPLSSNHIFLYSQYNLIYQQFVYFSLIDTLSLIGELHLDFLSIHSPLSMSYIFFFSPLHSPLSTSWIFVSRQYTLLYRRVGSLFLVNTLSFINELYLSLSLICSPLSVSWIFLSHR
jgi:hypothetical protein